MPNGDGQERHLCEAQAATAGRLLCYISRTLGKTPPPWAAAAAEDYYGAYRKGGDQCLPTLQALMELLNPAQIETLAYGNPHDKDARALADWWEHHQEEQKEDTEREQRLRERKRLAEQAAAKLTDDERNALGVARRGGD